MKRGWCPTVHEPMPTGDGLLVRVKPKNCRLTATEARFLAIQAAACGNGIIELTSRGNLQIRGLNAASAGVFADAMVASGLAAADPALERRRNLTVSPLAGADPMVAADTLDLADALEAKLAQDGSRAALPAKFAFVIDGGGALPVALQADVTLRTDGSRHWVNGTECLGGRDAAVAQACAGAGSPGDRRAASGALAGWIAYRGCSRGAFALGLPFGQTDSAQLASLADLAALFSDGVLRLSPRRAVLLGSVRAVEVAALAAAAAELGLITDATDPRLRMAACIGAGGCASGTVPAREDAARLATRNWAGPGDGFLHVSGCAKGCAHPGSAQVTLVGEAGRYNLVRRRKRSGYADADRSQRVTGSERAMTRDYERDGAAIYERSFATIRSEADLAGFSLDEQRVAVRIIHACGMTDIVSDLQFGAGFVASARAALLGGAPILCDSRMVAEGITRARLPAGNEVLCTLGDPRTAARAATTGTTRSAAALDLWGTRMGGAVIAIGNAPTALFHLLELLDEGAPPPAAIIGMPVGFVGAAESKQALAEDGRVAFAIVRGRRGGSAMAVAAVNALASERE